VGGAFEAYLARLAEQRREGATWLLTALAFSEGSGLPRKIWLPITRRLSGLPLREADIDVLLEENGSYIAIVEVAGTKHFRLYHQELTHHLQQRTLRTWDLPDIAHRYVETLMELTPDRDWLHAHPYVRSHLATHAATAGVIEDFVSDPLFILAAEPAGLLRAIRHVKHDQTLAMVVERCADILGDSAPTELDRAAQLAFVAESHGAVELAERAERLSSSVRRVRAEWRPITPHRIVGHHEEASYSTTRFRGGWRTVDTVLPDGSRVVVAASRHFSPYLHMWFLDDPSRSTVLPHSSEIVDLNVLSPDQEKVLAVTLDKSGDLRVWNLVDQTLTRHVVSTGYEAILDAGWHGAGRPLLVCLDGRRVVVQDATASPVFEVVCQHIDGAVERTWHRPTARLIQVAGGKPALLVCDNAAGTVVLWNLDETPSSTCLLDGLGVSSRIGAVQPSGSTVIAVIQDGGDGSRTSVDLMFLDCISRKVVRVKGGMAAPLRGAFHADELGLKYVVADYSSVDIIDVSSGLVRSVRVDIGASRFALYPPARKGEMYALSGDYTGGMQIIDCTSGKPVSAILRGHDGGVVAVHALGSARSWHLEGLTVGNDGTARLWRWQVDSNWRPEEGGDRQVSRRHDAMAYTEEMYRWNACVDTVVASSWSGFRLIDCSILDRVGDDRGKLIAVDLPDVAGVDHQWTEDSVGTVHVLARSEEFVDTAENSRSMATFSWYQIVGQQAVNSVRIEHFTKVPWAAGCHLAPVVVNRSTVSLLGYNPANGMLYAKASPGEDVVVKPCWWSLDPVNDFSCSTAFSDKAGNAVLIVGVRPALMGDSTLSEIYVATDRDGSDRRTDAYFWNGTSGQALRPGPFELPAAIKTFKAHHAVDGTRYLAMACSNGKAAVLDLDTDRVYEVHPERSAHDVTAVERDGHRGLANGDDYYLRWAETASGDPVLLYMDAADVSDSVLSTVTLWNSATPEASVGTLAVQARRLLWTGVTPNGEGLVAVSDEYGIAICHVSTGAKVWATPLPALVTSLTVINDAVTLDLAVGTQRGVVLLRPRISGSWRLKLGLE
jgi:WD40 repeat protein